jgi:hypothetical protein
MATRRDAERMRALLRKRERQGLTWAELSETSGVPRSTLHWWQRRLRDEDGPHFVRVDVTKDPDAGTREPIEILLRSGHRLLVRGGFDPEDLRRLVALLDSGC